MQVYHDLGNLCVTFFTHRDAYHRQSNLQLICDALTCNYNLDVGINSRDDLLLHNQYKVRTHNIRFASHPYYLERYYLPSLESGPITDTHLGRFQVKAGSHLRLRSHLLSSDFPGLSLLPPELKFNCCLNIK